MVQLTEIPERIARLPRDHRGYPVPWFVLCVDGKPQFPLMDQLKWRQAIRDCRCWVCGDTLGGRLAFVVGPMCGISRTSAEPPSHLECAQFSVRNCPFLVNPNMKRIDNEMTRSAVNPGGVMLKRNPGVTLVWVTRTFKIFRDENRNPLIEMGEPVGISVWREGRAATVDELEESIAGGLPSLIELAELPGEMFQLRTAVDRFRNVLQSLASLAVFPGQLTIPA